MATTYTSTIEVKVWKAHTCLRCRQPFRYLFERKKKGQGTTAAAASVAANKAVVKALAHEVNFEPCPHCGLYQPDMIATRRRRRHWYLFWFALVAIATLLILAATELLTYHDVALQATMLALVLLIGHLRIDLKDDNRDLEANMSLAERRIDAGQIWVPDAQPPGALETADVPGAWTFGHTLAYFLLLVTVGLVAAPLLMPSAFGWTLTPKWYPGVAGAGDAVHTYFPAKITSVKGYWNAQAFAEVENAVEVGLPAGTRLATRTKTDSWPQTIRIGSKESKTSTNTLWMTVILPNQPDLAGKTLRLKMLLQVNFPELQGAQFLNVMREFRHADSLTVSSPGCATMYRTTFWWALAGGGTLLVLLSMCLALFASAYRGQALPTEIFTPTVPDRIPSEA